MAAAVARHETRALLRAHLSAVAGYRHRTDHCPVCHRLLLLALVDDPDGGEGADPGDRGPAPRGPKPSA
ncbi:DUF6274 family protein [Streptomyces sp. NPDC060194]|uniref:DUF6274 family protein n=1 Tax=Streptomyces sp. NPDC060194 TaxID=3347069 RepID=UPI00364C256F